MSTQNTSVEEFLRRQKDLTAVERFCQYHEKDQTHHQEKYYKDLLPASAPRPGQQYAFEVDLDRCSGCKACVTACHNLNGLDEDETWRSVGLLQTKVEVPPPATVKWMTPAPVAVKGPPALFQQHVTTACHHCAEPTCLTGCPVNAYEKDSVTGIVKHLDDQCIGCQYCIYTCSYGVPQYNPKRGIVRKCDMCSGRLKAGEAPACVQACPNKAIRISLVEVKDAGKEFNIPSAPDPTYSRPTTRYTTSRHFPENTQAADHSVVRPQPAEHPLTFMLVLTQASVGAFLLLPFLPLSFIPVGSAVATAVGLVGLSLAILHLGRPLYAYRVILGLGHSWLSREAVVLGLFAQLALLTTVLAWKPFFGGPALLKTLLVATGAVGLFGVYCSAMIYRATPREWWASRDTLWKFFLTMGSLGPPLLVLAGVSYPWFFLLTVVSIVAKGIVGARVIGHQSDVSLTALRKTALLHLGPFWGLFQLRIFLGVGSLVVLGAAVLWPTPVLVFPGILMCLVAELLERHLFFVAVAPPKMPGVL
jgi:Fe-S-cluster-containing dehydrogenase component/DMSO reductase anchor subunit